MKHKKNRHHLTPKIRGGGIESSNLLTIDIDKHIYWHRIFGTLTLEEVINLLIRLKKMKGRN